MLYGNLRDFAEAIIKGDKYKAPSGNLRDLAQIARGCSTPKITIAPCP